MTEAVTAPAGDVDLTPYSLIHTKAWFGGAAAVLILFGWMLLLVLVASATDNIQIFFVLGGLTLAAVLVLFVITTLQRMSRSTAGRKRAFLKPADRDKPAPGFGVTFGAILERVAAMGQPATGATPAELAAAGKVSAGQRLHAIAYTAAGFLLVLLGLPLLFLLRLGGALLGVAVVLVVAGMYGLFNRGRRAMMKSAEAVTRYDRRPPILYLRSFRDDKVKLMQRVDLAGLPAAQPLRLEEALAFMVRDFGPFLAVGEPGEGLPELGAARAYLPEDQWQEQVTAWIREARFIVMLAGPTQWIHWEMQKIIAHDRIEHLLLVLPPGRKPGSKPVREREARWANIVRSLEATPYASALQALDIRDVILVQFRPDHTLRAYRSAGDLAQDYELAVTLAIYAANS